MPRTSAMRRRAVGKRIVLIRCSSHIQRKARTVRRRLKQDHRHVVLARNKLGGDLLEVSRVYVPDVLYNHRCQGSARCLESRRDRGARGAHQATIGTSPTEQPIAAAVDVVAGEDRLTRLDEPQDEI